MPALAETDMRKKNEHTPYILGISAGLNPNQTMTIGFALMEADEAPQPSAAPARQLHSAGVRTYSELAMDDSLRDWEINLAANTAYHRTLGLLVQFTRDPDGAARWSGELVQGTVPDARLSDTPTLLREAGDAWGLAMQKAGKTPQQ